MKNINQGLFAMTCWAIWNCRNKARLNETVIPLEKLEEQAHKLLREFQTANPIHSKLVSPARPTWKPPDPDELKTNFDRAIFEDLNAAGIGVVHRGGARNFGLGGPSCNANILVKTNLYTYMYIN